MSTLVQTRIRELEQSGVLVRYMSRASKPAKRALFLCPDAQKDLNNPASATNILVGRPGIIAAMERWVTGGLVYGSRRGEFLDRLKPPPPEVWEIRVTVPVVQARLFGRFAQPNTLILTKFHTRRLLGGRGSKAWKEAMEACVQCWETHFPSIPVFSASSIHAYVTENCDAFPI